MRATGHLVCPELFCRRSHTLGVHRCERFEARFESINATSQTLNFEFPLVYLGARRRQPSGQVFIFDLGTVQTKARFTKQISNAVGPIEKIAFQ